MKKITAIVYGLLLVALLVAPFAGAYPVFVMKLMCFALFASAFNLLLGYTGLLSFGHAAFLGGSAYVAGYAMRDWGLTPELGLLAGTITGGLLGWLFGVLAIRRQGIYFAMITLALAQMIFFVALQARFTGGEDGLQGVPRGKLFGLLDLQSDLTMYYVTLVIVVAAFLLIVRTIHSPFGQVLKGIKENEPRALGARGLAQDAGAGLRHAVGRALERLGAGDPDDAGRRPRHALGSAGGRGRGRTAREQDRRVRQPHVEPHGHRVVQHAGRIGDHGDRPDLRDLRAGLPARHHGRDHRLLRPAAAGVQELKSAAPTASAAAHSR
jgi:hypothetical protein